MHFTSIAAATVALFQAFYAAADEIHLVNCNGNNLESQLVYCATGVDCDATVPSSSDYCQKSSGSLWTWEGGEQSCTFSTGVTFEWDLASGVGTFDYAGWGYNGYNNYNCYRDDDAVMAFTISGSDDTCNSIYYCLED